MVGAITWKQKAKEMSESRLMLKMAVVGESQMWPVMKHVWDLSRATAHLINKPSQLAFSLNELVLRLVSGQRESQICLLGYSITLTLEPMAPDGRFLTNFARTMPLCPCEVQTVPQMLL